LRKSIHYFVFRFLSFFITFEFDCVKLTNVSLIMKIQDLILTLFFVSTFFLLSGQNQITLNADLGEHKISRHIYGHFSEHLGRCIYGGFYVGEDNQLIPHTKGIRKDVVEALKKLQIPNLRWPGGCFADTYHWKDGVGPKEKRPTIVNTWWGGITEDNSFGTHEFLDLCTQLETEPFISGNIGSGTVQELADWVQYVNAGHESPMSALRTENGKQEPWSVQYWGVGNEAWGCGGNMRPEYYADLYRQYATYMKTAAKGNQLYRIAAGASSSDYNWTEVLMKNIPLRLMEGISLHHYSVIDWGAKGPSTDFTEEQYFTTMQRALRMDELIKKHTTIMDKYDPEKKIALVVDEWGGWYDVEPGTNPGFLFQQNTMRDAMIAGTTLNIFNNHCERVKIANLAQTINVLQAVILTEEEKMLLTPTYHVMEMYTVHHDATMIPIHLQSEQYQYGEKTLPAISGSSSKSENGNLNISLVNIDPGKSHEVTVNLRGMNASDVTGRILVADKIQEHNTFDRPNKVKPDSFKDAKLEGDQLKVIMPPGAVVVLILN
jgi:alpha-N-arabinofuranosidase